MHSRIPLEEIASLPNFYLPALSWAIVSDLLVQQGQGWSDRCRNDANCLTPPQSQPSSWEIVSHGPMNRLPQPATVPSTPLRSISQARARTASFARFLRSERPSEVISCQHSGNESRSRLQPDRGLRARSPGPAVRSSVSALMTASTSSRRTGMVSCV